MYILEAVKTDSVLVKDILRTLLHGDSLGEGMSRKVFALRNDDTKVLKIEDSSYVFQNVLEYDAWSRVRWTDFHEWLAPCIEISPCGCCLVMARTQPLGTHSLPKFVPEWLTDTKPENWGWMDGRIVCHDYGHNRLMDVGLTKKVVRADWRF